MSIIKTCEVEDCRFRVLDVSAATHFLTDFGLLPVERVERPAYFRGTDPAAWWYSVEEGSQRFLGLAFGAAGEADLRTLTEATGRPVEAIDGPGGGLRMRLQEPNGDDVPARDASLRCREPEGVKTVCAPMRARRTSATAPFQLIASIEAEHRKACT